MDPDQKRLWAVVGGLAIVALAFILFGRVRQELEPEAVAAHVAIEVEGSPARIGPVEIAAGTDFTLRAVLEARGRGGERVFHTEATRLWVDGAEVPAEALRGIEPYADARVLWFTVEGSKPYVDST